MINMDSLTLFQKSLYLSIKEKIMGHMKWDEKTAETWMNTPNTNFGGTSPAQLILLGRGHKVEDFVDSAIEGY